MINTIKTIVCDDHPIICDAVATTLSTADGIEVVGRANDTRSTMMLMAAEHVDVAVLDVHIGEENGLELAKMIRAQYPDTRILFLTAYTSDEVLLEASRLGAADLMDKSADPTLIVERVREVAAGRSFLDRIHMSSALQRLNESGVLALLSLGHSDRELLSLVAQGLPDKQISQKMYLSPQTIRNRISRLLSILGRENRTQLALMMQGLDSTVTQLPAPERGVRVPAAALFR